jgi:hypothetical protein
MIPSSIDIKLGNYTIPIGYWASIRVNLFGYQYSGTVKIGEKQCDQQIYVKEGTVVGYAEQYNSYVATAFCPAYSYNSASGVATASTKLTINGGTYFLGFYMANTSFVACNMSGSAVFFAVGPSYTSYASGSYVVELFVN